MKEAWTLEVIIAINNHFVTLSNEPIKVAAINNHFVTLSNEPIKVAGKVGRDSRGEKSPGYRRSYSIGFKSLTFLKLEF